jgi:exodeoxyribonuclease-3
VKIATWNVNSIRARWERVLGWLEAVRPDVLCMQETKVPDEEFPTLELRAVGYHVVLCGQKTYNGVAIAAREPPTEVACGLGDGGDDSQSRLIAATVGGVRFLSAYVPNGQAVGSEKYGYKLAWMERLARHLAAGYRPEQPLVLAGDFNVAPADLDVHDPAAWRGQIMCSDDERAALAEICRFGLADAFRRLHPTEVAFSWWDYRQLSFPRNRGLRIDHVLVTPPLVERLRSAAIDREARKGKQPSDHAPVIVELG